MELEDLILAIFKKEQNPIEIKELHSLKKLNEIHDEDTLYFIDRNAETISALYIQEYFPIDNERIGVIKGEWDLGSYNQSEGIYFSMGKHPVTRLQIRPQFVTQERLDKEEVFVKSLFREFMEE